MVRAEKTERRLSSLWNATRAIDRRYVRTVGQAAFPIDVLTQRRLIVDRTTIDTRTLPVFPPFPFPFPFPIFRTKVLVECYEASL